MKINKLTQCAIFFVKKESVEWLEVKLFAGLYLSLAAWLEGAK